METKHPTRIGDLGEAPVRRFDARLQHLDHVEQSQRQHADVRRLEREMRSGLLAGDFHVHYQPIVTLPEAQIVAVEALLRWEHPVRGPVPPFEFIPIAEQSDLILELGTWVLHEACRQVREWQLAVPALRFLRVAVNLSARQLKRDLVGIVASVLDQTGLPSESLEIEITESVVMADIDGALEVLDAIAALGVSLSIDDFGTGYSSFAYLKRLPVGTLKIDKSFIDDLCDDQRDVSIVGAVIAVATALGLTQIAEGVETEGQRRQLEDLGCAHAQGYLFSRPCPASSFVEDVRHLFATDLTDARRSATPVQVVVCDDELSIRKLYRRALRSRDADVFDAATALECLAQIDAIVPDLVILDANLPDRSGIDIIAEITDRHPGAKVVVVSGTVSSEMFAASQAAGAHACMQKMQFLPLLTTMVDGCRA